MGSPSGRIKALANARRLFGIGAALGTLLVSGLGLTCEARASSYRHSISVGQGFVVAHGAPLPKRRYLALAIADPDFIRADHRYRFCANYHWSAADADGIGREIRFKIKPRVLRAGKEVRIKVIEETFRPPDQFNSQTRCWRAKARLRLGDIVVWRYRMRQTSDESPRIGMSMRSFLTGVNGQAAAAAPRIPEPSNPFAPSQSSVPSAEQLSDTFGDTWVTYYAVEEEEVVQRRTTAAWVIADDTFLRNDHRYEFCVAAYVDPYGIGPSFRALAHRLRRDSTEKIVRVRSDGAWNCKVKTVHLEVGDVMTWDLRYDYAPRIAPGFQFNPAYLLVSMSAAPETR